MPIINERGELSAWHWVWWALVALVFLVLAGWGITAATFGMRVATAGLVGRGEARIQIQSAASRITNYEHFFDMCAAVQGQEGSIDAQLVALGTAERDRDRSRININIAALQSLRQQSIAQYNADAFKDYTRGQFRDSDLPYQIEA